MVGVQGWVDRGGWVQGWGWWGIGVLGVKGPRCSRGSRMKGA